MMGIFSEMERSDLADNIIFTVLWNEDGFIYKAVFFYYKHQAFVDVHFNIEGRGESQRQADKNIPDEICGLARRVNQTLKNRHDTHKAYDHQ